jgi:outer membrane protein OmpA-like peptidoglycan-associated protein
LNARGPGSNGLSFGAGLLLPWYGNGLFVDYAFSEMGYIGETHRIGVNYAVGAPPVKKTIIKGEVVDAKTGEPVFADISFPATKLEPVKTDEYGKFEKSLTKEQIEIIVSANGYKMMTKTVALKPGRVIDLVFALTPKKATVAGKVTNEKTGEPVQASVAIAGMRPVITDIYGNYSIKVEPGTYRLEVESDGYTSITKEVILERGKTVEINFSLSPTFVIPKGGLSLKEIVSLRIQFAFDKAILRKDVKISLNNLALTLIHNPDLKLEIQGYTCEVGTEEYNMGLSIRRARAVRDYLVDKGTEKSRLEIKGFGETRPIDPRHSEAARAKNRRVKFIVIK